MSKKFNLTEVKKATVLNPRTMLLFSYPKVGKTEACTQLPGKSLIIDFEGGTDYYDARAVNVDNLADLDALKAQFKEEQPRFNFIVLDTLTTLFSKVVNQIAVRSYNKEHGKKQPLTWDITRLEFGRGHSFLREGLQNVMAFFAKYCDTLILNSHVADRALVKDDGTGQVKDIDLPGKLKNIISVKTDAVALLYRKDLNVNYVNFISSESLIAGTRSQHLAGKEFLLSERDEDGKLTTNWKEIFIKPEKKKVQKVKKVAEPAEKKPSDK